MKPLILLLLFALPAAGQDSVACFPDSILVAKRSAYVQKFSIPQSGAIRRSTVATDTLRVAVVLAQWYNVPHYQYGTRPNGFTRDDFENMLFSASNEWFDTTGATHPQGFKIFGSVAEYYRDWSGGRVAITGVVVNPDSVTNQPLWITVPDTFRLMQPSGVIPYDGSIGEHAVDTAVARGWLNTSEWDYVQVVVSGYGRASACISELYPQETAPIDDQVFNSIGVFCHEWGHMLFGFYDEYITGYIYQADSTWSDTDRWDLMSYGTYNGQWGSNPATWHSGGNQYGACPAPPNPFDRIEAGWLIPTYLVNLTHLVVTDYGSEQTVFSTPLNVWNDYHYQAIHNPDYGTYFVLEARRRNSWKWNKYTPEGPAVNADKQTGLFIWRSRYKDPVELVPADTINTFWANTMAMDSLSIATSYYDKAGRWSADQMRENCYADLFPTIGITGWLAPKSIQSFTPTSVPPTKSVQRFVGIHVVADSVIIDTVDVGVAGASVLTSEATNVTPTTATLRGFIWSTGKCQPVFRIGTTRGTYAFCGSLDSVIGSVNVSIPVTGLAPGTKYYNRLEVGSSYGVQYGNVDSLTTAFSTTPYARTDSASLVAWNSLKFWGHASSLGSGPTTVRFLIGVGSYTNFTDSIDAQQGTISGLDTIQVYATKTNLAAPTIYYYKTVSISQTSGVRVSGTVMPYQIGSAPVGLPNVSAPYSDNITATGAQLHATIWPNSYATSDSFIYVRTGLTDTARVAGVPSPVNGSSGVTVAKTLSGLISGTNYSWYAKGKNVNGTAATGIQTFTTTATKSAPALTDIHVTGTGKTYINVVDTLYPGNDSTTVVFDYTRTRGNWSIYPPISGSEGTLTGAGPYRVTTQISGLLAGWKYWFRARATSPTGRDTSNTDSTTTLPDFPGVVTQAVSPFDSTHATATGTINPHGATTIAGFYIRDSANTWSRRDTVSGWSYADTANHTATKVQDGLAPDTRFYLKAWALNSVGYREGSEVTFRTRALSPAPKAPDIDSLWVTHDTTGATFYAIISANGSGTAVFFQYGPQGTETGTVIEGDSVTTDGVTDTVSVTGLTAGSPYQVQVFAINEGGEAVSAVVYFVTDPLAIVLSSKYLLSPERR